MDPEDSKQKHIAAMRLLELPLVALPTISWSEETGHTSLYHLNSSIQFSYTDYIEKKRWRVLWKHTLKTRFYTGMSFYLDLETYNVGVSVSVMIHGGSQHITIEKTFRKKINLLSI